MKRLIWIILTLILVVSLSSCNKDENPSATTLSGDSGQTQTGEETSDTSESGEQSSETTFSDTPDYQLPYEFEFNPYVLSWEYEELYGEEFVQVYKSFVDAYMNYETDFSCPSEDMFFVLYSALRYNMPYFQSDAYLTFDCYDSETMTGEIYYSSSSEAEHNNFVNAFIGEISDIILSCLQKDDNELEKAVALYQEFSSSVLYDGDAPDENISPYYALMYKTGICQSFAGAYAYLLRQVGITANTCSGLTYDSTAAHEWCIVKIDGKFYYVDPTYENGETGGLGLSYFGMTVDEREEAGSFDPRYFSIGMTNEIWGDDFDITDTRFSDLRGSYYFKIDRQNSRIAYWVTGTDNECYFSY